MKDIPFSKLCPSILESERGLRVARQILAVLEGHLKSAGLAKRRVLDIGSSSGIITSFLADFTGSIVGVDVDTEAIRLAAASPRRPNLEFMVMSGSDLGFASESFDLVICNQVYCWFDDAERLMAEIKRVLKPGGYCFFAGVNKYALWEAQYRLPFLSFLPKRLADLFVRAARRGDRFGCHYLSFWRLRHACRTFIIHRYTARIVKDPESYKFTRLAILQRVTGRLPIRWLEVLEPLSPNFVWVLERPRSTSP